LGADGLARARALATWRERVQAAWKDVAVRAVRADTVTALAADDTRAVQADVALGTLRPEDVSVALYAGPIGGQGEILDPAVSEMKVEGAMRDGVFVFGGTLSGRDAGRHGFRVRVLPAHEDLASPLTLNRIVWG
jgi:glycogen phosphorylase